jgi:hypothetical protein
MGSTCQHYTQVLKRLKMSTYNVASTILLSRGIDGIFSLNNSRFIDDVNCIYLLEQILTDTTNTARYTSSYYNAFFNYWDDLNFHVVNFPFICSNIPAAPTDGVYVSQLKWFSASWRSPSRILLSFIDSVSQMRTATFGLYWLQVISFVFAHDLAPCLTYDRLLASAASWMSLGEQDSIYHLEHFCPNPVVMGFLLLKL